LQLLSDKTYQGSSKGYETLASQICIIEDGLKVDRVANCLQEDVFRKEHVSNDLKKYCDQELY